MVTFQHPIEGCELELARLWLSGDIDAVQDLLLACELADRALPQRFGFREVEGGWSPPRDAVRTEIRHGVRRLAHRSKAELGAVLIEFR